MSSIYLVENRNVVFMKGAPEVLLSMCNYVQLNDNREKMSEDFPAKVNETIQKFTSNGLVSTPRLSHILTRVNNQILIQRTLAFAYSPNLEDPRCARDMAEKNEEMTFLGVLGIYDPPRRESRRAVEMCREAGIRVHMATGDHPKTAANIAKAVNIIQDETEMTATSVITAAEFDKMSDYDIDNLAQLPLVIARCSPATKVNLVRALHRRGMLVAMTGDGVNDVRRNFFFIFNLCNDKN